MSHSELSKPDSRYWYILGDAYDLSDFQHPGGRDALAWSQGQADATHVLLSYHLQDGSSLLTKLEKFHVEDAPRFDPFFTSLSGSRYDTAEKRSAVVNDVVIRSAKKAVVRSGQTAPHAPRSAILFYVLTYSCSVWAAYRTLALRCTLSAIAWPFLHWLASINMAHDAGHHAVLRGWPRLNILLSYASLPFAYEPYDWQYVHNYAHHLFTNCADLDRDFSHPSITKTARHSYDQAWYFWMPITWPIFLVAHMVLATSFLVGISQIFGIYHRSNWRSWLAPVSWLLVIVAPWATATESSSLAQNIVLSMAPCSLYSCIFWVVTQSSHLHSDTIASGKIGLSPGSWGLSQALTSLNYSPESTMWTALTGALNIQSAHHLLPFVHSWRLCKIWPYLEEELRKEHGICLKQTPDLFNAFLSYVRQLRRASNNIVDE
jgi:hypothetical protein